jgi:predicted ATPase/class 3 adenylate cyclase
MIDHLPVGTITFLFTDIEGSTRLWERQPEAMTRALARHDVLLRGAIEGCGGTVFKTVGDAFCAAFAYAPDALAAVLGAQRALHAEAWPAEIGAIHIRAALHTGAVEHRDGDYFGPPLNRVARLLSAGHGDQTLLSLATQELVRDSLPSTTSLRDLGEHRLKDLFRPERVYQLVARDLPSEFPPLRTLDVKLTNLPAQPTPFIGRDRELVAVLALLRHEDVRLVTLTGPGGTGKTRLSLQAAADLLDEYEHGAYFVPLATITDPDLVIPTIAAIFNVSESGGQSIDALLKQYLAEKHLLLVLDNLEQVVSAAPKIAELLAAAPRLKIITSSREKLRLYGEHEYPVPPLGLPDLKKKPTLVVLSQYESVALFLQRAKAANPHFEITEANAPAVAEICVRLEGLPLAIELAAARARLLAPQAMLERLSSQLKALTGGARDLPARQQTIRGTIDWSYNLLDEGEKMLFARLGVFVGGWTIEAAEEVCGSSLPSSDGLALDVFDGLEALSDKSLIRQVEGVEGETRFMMLETIREYAAEKLAESGEAETIRSRHLAAFAALAVRAEPECMRHDQVLWLERLEEDLDNVRAAVEWSLHHDVETGLRMAAAMGKFCIYYGYVGDGALWLSQLLAQAESLPPSTARARALGVYSYMLQAQGHISRARPIAAEGTAMYRHLGDRHGEIDCLMGAMAAAFGAADMAAVPQEDVAEIIAFYRQAGDKVGLAQALWLMSNICDHHDYAGARGYLNESLALWREMGNRGEMVTVLNALGVWALWHQDYAVARAILEESLTINYTVNKRGSTAVSLHALGHLALQEGDYDRAIAYLEDSLSELKERGDQIGGPWTSIRLGYAVLRQGDLVRARALFGEGLSRFQERGMQAGVIYALEGLASLAVTEGQAARAARLFGWADGMREAVNDVRPPTEQTDVDRDVATIRGQINDAAFDAAQVAGRGMLMDEAVALGLGGE